MASEEHKLLSEYIKGVHLMLRQSTYEIGVDAAWQKHCGNEDILLKYAQCMEKLATTHWETNCNSNTSEATSRIKWVADFCNEYFNNKGYLKYTERDITIALKIETEIKAKESFTTPLKLIDVGSCYNPFSIYDIFDVLAIDLCPANNSVMQCDFLNVKTGESNHFNGSTVTELEENAFDIVTFCFLLEYIPSSELRILACQKAYKLLKSGGLLVITTPDSKHVGANYKHIKCWRYALALMGFTRIKYEKSRFMHCMAFRKALHTEIAVRWANMYKEPYMEYTIHIPQDFNSLKEEDISTSIDNENVVDDFQELPFDCPQQS